MENFLLTYTPISTITVATALYKHAESGSWSGNREQEVQKFVKTLENVKNTIKRTPGEEERLRKLRNFGTGEGLRQRYLYSSEWTAPVMILTAIDYIYSLVELDVLQIDVMSWQEDANANIDSLKREVRKRTNETSGYEKQMWERVETELHDINVSELGFDHPLCSGILDIKSKPFTKMPTSLCNIFQEPFQKYKLTKNNAIFNMCEKFVMDEEGKISSKYDISGNIEFGRWVDQPEKLEQITRELLEAMGKVWRSPKYKLFIKDGEPQVLRDMLEIYAMRKETGIFKYCLLEQAPIPLHIATPTDVYALIHILLTLRTAVA
ncbi:4899_t:CDS:2, partial [Racocetra persica]